MGDFDVVAGAGTLRAAAGDVVRFPYQWTPAGVTVEAASAGPYLLAALDAVAEIPSATRAAAPVTRAVR